MAYNFNDLDLRPRVEHYCRACGETCPGPDPDMCCLVDPSTVDIDVIRPGAITVEWVPREVIADA
jgi:hypothetical protein